MSVLRWRVQREENSITSRGHSSSGDDTWRKRIIVNRVRGGNERYGRMKISKLSRISPSVS